MKENEGRNRITGIAAVLPQCLFMLVFIVQLALDVFLAPSVDDQAVWFTWMARGVNAVSFLCFIAAAVVLVKKKKQDMSSKLFPGGKLPLVFLAGFLLLMAASTAVNGISRDVLLGMEYRNVGILALFTYAISYVCLPGSVFREKHRKTVALMFLLTSDLIAAAGLFHLLSSPVFAFAGKKGLSTVFLNGNHYAYFLSMATVLGFYMTCSEKRTEAVFSFVSFVLSFGMLLANNSAGAFIAVFSGIAIASVILSMRGVSRMRILPVVLFPLAAVVIIYILSVQAETADTAGKILAHLYRNLLEGLCDAGNIAAHNSVASSAGSNRMRLWRESMHLIFKKPLFGYGLEGTSLMLAEKTGIYNAHNELLTFAGYFGIPAAGCYLAFVLTALAGALKRASSQDFLKTGLALTALSYFLSSMFGTMMFYTYPLFMMFLGDSSAGEAEDSPDRQ